MNIKDLENKWNLLNPESNAGYKSLRISSDCFPDLYIGIDIHNGRCLILKLPSETQINFQSVIKQHLSIELHRETSWIVLKLLDNSFADLFNDLILSIYNKIKDEKKVKEYTSILIETFYKWSDFFEDNNFNQLSEETIMGIFGEILFLNDSIIKADPIYINEVLSSWKGPYDTGHDFIFKEKNIEVKTKNLHSQDIRISSEYQLEPEPEKPFFLVVLNTLKDNSGSSLSDLITASRQLIRERMGDFSILLKALSQKGLTLTNVSNYNGLRYKPVNITHYNCTHKDFPKIVASDIDRLLNNVKYNIRIAGLDSFITDKREY